MHCILIIAIFYMLIYILFFKGFYLFIFRERGREGDREGEKHWCEREISIGCLLHAPSWEPGLQSRHMPRWRIEPATLLFVGWRPTHWATSVRAVHYFCESNWFGKSCGGNWIFFCSTVPSLKLQMKIFLYSLLASHRLGSNLPESI